MANTLHLTIFFAGEKRKRFFFFTVFWDIQFIISCKTPIGQITEQ